MKRLLTVITAAILLAGCEYINQVIPLKPEETPEAAEPAKEEIQTVGEYTIHNISGTPVTALYLYPTGSSDKGKNYAESVLAEDNRIVLKYDAGEKAKEAELTLEFTTESGYTAAFTSLHIETASISLLAEDALTGPTPIAFQH